MSDNFYAVDINNFHDYRLVGHCHHPQEWKKIRAREALRKGEHGGELIILKMDYSGLQFLQGKPIHSRAIVCLPVYVLAYVN